MLTNKKMSNEIYKLKKVGYTPEHIALAFKTSPAAIRNNPGWKRR